MSANELMALFRDLEATDLAVMSDCDSGVYKMLDNRLFRRGKIIENIANQVKKVDTATASLESVVLEQKKAKQRDNRIRNLVKSARDEVGKQCSKVRGAAGNGLNPYAEGPKSRLRVTL